jgi:peptidoglycan/LPS O-acetylase OafA/YrhL
MNKSLIQPSYLPALTTLRAVAAFMVFLHHKNFIPTFGNQFAEIFIFQGYTGVTLFFVLSGFLIHRNYVLKIPNFNLSFLKSYFLNRFARIYPMYFLVLMLTMMNAPKVDSFFWFLQLSLFKGFSDLFKFSAVATSWSLTVEECFYFFFPILALLRNRKINYLLLLAAIYIIGYGLLKLGTHINFAGFFTSFTFVSLYTFFGRAFEFILGMWASELVLNNKFKTFAKPIYTYLGLSSIAAILFLLSFISWLNRKDNTEFQIVSMFIPEGFWVHQFVLPLAFALLVVGLSIEKTHLQKIFSYSYLQLLGKSSYVFYLLQGGVFYLYFDKFFPHSENILLFITMLLVSILMFLLLEDPINRLIRRKENIFLELKKLFTHQQTF